MGVTSPSAPCGTAPAARHPHPAVTPPASAAPAPSVCWGTWEGVPVGPSRVRDTLGGVGRAPTGRSARPALVSLPTASCRACEMDPALFEVPRGYSVVGTHQDALREDEDDLLQFAIQQSLLEAGSEYDQVGTATPSPLPVPLAHPIVIPPGILTPSLPLHPSHGGGSEFMLGGLIFGLPPSKHPLSPATGDHLGSTDQQQAGHPPLVARGPPRRQVGKVRPAPLGGAGVGAGPAGPPLSPCRPQDSPAHGSPASPRGPGARGWQGARGPVPQLRRAAAPGHGAVGAGAGGSGAPDAPGGGGSAEDPAALADGEVTPQPH